MEFEEIKPENINPELEFTPKRRRLEFKLVEDAKKALDEMDISKEEKDFQKGMWDDYWIEYNHEYRRHHNHFNSAYN